MAWSSATLVDEGKAARLGINSEGSANPVRPSNLFTTVSCFHRNIL